MYASQQIASATENWNYTSHGSQTAIQNTRAGQSAAVIVPTNISGDGTTVTVTYANTGQWFSGQAPFVSGTYITIAGAQPAGYNGTYRVATNNATTLTFLGSTTGTMIIPGTLTQGMVNSIVANPASQSYASDVHTFTTAPGSAVTPTATLATVNNTSATFARPVGFPVFLATAVNNTLATTAATGTGFVSTLTFTALASAPYAVGATITVAGVTPAGYNGTYTVTACTTTTVSYANATTAAQTVAGTIKLANGAVGQQISISDSPTAGGRMAFWDTTNTRWSYISDNAAV
jgi:hypothetical protein